MPPKRKGKAEKDVEKTTHEKEEADGLIPPAPETQKENETQHQVITLPKAGNFYNGVYREILHLLSNPVEILHQSSSKIISPKIRL